MPISKRLIVKGPTFVPAKFKPKGFQITHEELDKKVKEFLANGGAIVLLPPMPNDTRNLYLTTQKPIYPKYEI